MTSHEELRAILDDVQRCAVKFEHNAHLGQPIRSWDVYAETIAIVAELCRTTQSFPPTRDGLSAVRVLALAASKQDRIDRDVAASVLLAQVAMLQLRVAQAKASRR